MTACGVANVKDGKACANPACAVVSWRGGQSVPVCRSHRAMIRRKHPSSFELVQEIR